jgi:hypothetical protein
MRSVVAVAKFVGVSNALDLFAKAEHTAVDMKGKILILSELLNSARKSIGDGTFLLHCTLTNTCQVFIKALAEVVGLLLFYQEALHGQIISIIHSLHAFWNRINVQHGSLRCAYE